MNTLIMSMACLTVTLQSPETLEDLVGELVVAGYEQDDDALVALIESLSSVVDGRDHLIAYWQGYAYWRRAQREALASGRRVEEFVDAAVLALERSVRLRAQFADGHALLAGMYDYQMAFHHGETRRWVRLANASLARAAGLAPNNPRVALAQAIDVLFAPVQYGGSVPKALAKLVEVRELLDGEALGSRSLPLPLWGAVDVELYTGDAHLALEDASAAKVAFLAAIDLMPECVEALERGLPACHRVDRLLEGAELAELPLSMPALDVDLEGWPRWRGPRRDGKGIESEWSSEGVEAWRVDVGLGYSGMTVADGRLFTKGYDLAAGKDVVFAFDAHTGEELWCHSLPAAIWNEMHGGGTLSSPTVDGDRVYTLNREGKLHCFDAISGRVNWQRDLVDEEGLRISRWGFAASPVIVGDQILLNVGRVLSIDKHTGKRQWRTRHYGSAYSTPTPFVVDGQLRLATFLGQGLFIIDVCTGEELAQYPWKTTYNQNCASPVLVGEDIFISSGMNRGCAMLTLAGDALIETWGSKAMRNTMTACVVKDGMLYGFDDRVLRCVDVNGNKQWGQRGLGWGALTIAGDRLLVMSEDGELTIANATPESFEVLHQVKIFDQGQCWASPVMADGFVYLRSNRGELVCRDHR